MWHCMNGKNMRRVSALTVALMLAAAPNMALAKRGGDGDNRSEFYGPCPGTTGERPAR
jgi:hypothetical protein